MKKNKLIKKSIDIESEFVGKSVGPHKKKEKKSDLTEAIQNFLSSEITFDSITQIILRIEGRYTLDKFSKIAKMKIYGMKGFEESVNVFFIFIKVRDSTSLYKSIKYYLTESSFYKMNYFGSDSITSSPLKRELGHTIWKWLCDNSEKMSQDADTLAFSFRE